VILTSDIHKGFINNSPTICTFLDIKGAFDNVVPNILIQDLKNISIPAQIRMFILNLICERQLHFVIDGNMADPFLSLKGTPQGSTLSLILFDIYQEDIVNYLHNESNILLYADIVIYSTANNIHLAYKSVQNTLDRIAKYLRNRGLNLSPEKSQWMVFIRSRILPVLPSLKICGSSVPRIIAARFLEIIFDSGMSGSVLIDILVVGYLMGFAPSPLTQFISIDV